jgi:hypothetical protein
MIDLVRVSINPDIINIKNKIVHLNTVDLQQINYVNKTYQRNKPPSTITKIDTNKVTKNWQLFGWDITADKIIVRNSSVANSSATVRAPYAHFDGQHLYFTNINADINKLKWNTDTVTFHLDIDAKERCGFVVDKLKSKIKAYPNTIEFDELSLKTPNSSIKDKVHFSFTDFKKDISNFITNIQIDASFKESKIAFKDLEYFAPTLKKYNTKSIFINGQANGTVASFTTQDLTVNDGSSTIKGNLIMNGLPDINSTYINLKNGNVQTSYNDLTFWAPQLKNVKGANLSALGNINYQGAFSGFINDFVLYGSLNSNLGNVETDLALTLPNDNTLPSYNAKILTTGFNLGKLLNNSKLGNLGFNGNIQGKGFSNSTIDANINGTTTSLQFGNYTYTNINTIGNYKNNAYNGTIVANDENLIADLKGNISFGEKINVKLVGKIDKSDFKKLQFTKDDLKYKGTVNVDIAGKNINDINGEIDLSNATFSNKNETLPFSFLKVKSTKTSNGQLINFNSDQFDGFINGKFSPNNLASAFSSFLHQYYPEVFKKPSQIDANQKFDIELNTRDVSAYLKILSNELSGLNDAKITGAIDTENNLASFNGTIPFLQYNKYKLYDLTLIGAGSSDSLTTKIDMNNFSINDSLVFELPNINLTTKNNETQFAITSNSNTTVNKLNVNGKLQLFDDGLAVNFEPSNFIINGKEWTLEKNGELIVRNGFSMVNDIKFKHSDEEILLRNESTESNNIVAELKNIEINDFMPLFVKTNSFYGKLNGTINVINPAENQKIEAKQISITDFVKDNEAIGTIYIDGDFDVPTKKANYTLKSDNNNYKFNVTGSYNALDSLTPINNKIVLNGTNVSLIQPYLNTIFDNTTGRAFGELELFGNNDKQYIIGAATVDTFTTIVKFTNVKYHAYNPLILLNVNDLDFTGMELLDEQNRKAKVVSGKITHSGFFKNMDLNIDIRSSNIDLINTNRFINSSFYGKAVGDVRFSIKGKVDEKLRMDLDVLNPTSGDIVFNTNAVSKTTGKASFIEFKEYGTLMRSDAIANNSSLDIFMHLIANPNAKITVVLDEATGDQLEATGNGDLNIFIGNSDIKMNGEYIVDQGKYGFSRTALFNKTFALKKDSYIKWNGGDPTNAIISIEALYEAKNVSLSELYKSSFNANNNTSTSPTSSITASSNLLVTATLSENLSKPKITFAVSIPDGQTKDPQLVNILTDMQKDQSELAKQVAFLVIFNRLFQKESGINNVLDRTFAYNSLSSIITGEVNNELNKLLQNSIAPGLRSNLDFRTYSFSDVNTQDFKRAIGTLGLTLDIIKDKLTIYANGNIDFNLNASTRDEVKLLPNIVLEYKLQSDGSIVATFFHRQSLDLLNTASNGNSSRKKSSGGGLARRKSANSFADLFRKRKKIGTP